MKHLKKILIGEDDVLTAEHLKDILNSLGYIVTGIYHNKNDILSALLSDKPDIVLLDINMDSRFTGVEIGEYMLKEIHIPVVYITAHSDKTTLDKAFQTQPDGYIVKPFKVPDIEVAIQLIANRLGESEKVLSVKDGQAFVKIPFSDILYLKANDNYVDVNCNSKRYMVRSGLKEIIEKLDANTFIRTHRSYIVNKNFVLAFDKNIELNDGTKIPVSKQYTERVKFLFRNH